jgi:hypothetical protein
MKASPVTSLGLLTLCFESAWAEDAYQNDSDRTLKSLYGREPVAKMIGGKAKAVDRKGLMAGLGIHGSKITKLEK